MDTMGEFNNQLLTIVIPVKNEEKNLPACLENVREFANVVVVDSGSTDRTRAVFEMAREGGGRSFEELRQWRRQKAEEKVVEWSVERGSFVAALGKLVAEKRTAGEWLFESEDEVARAIGFAQRFFTEYSRKIVQLSDGRCVYFAPDERAKARHCNLAFCWAEYAFHAVSSGGARIPGKTYNYRKYNERKVENTDLIEGILLAEKCVPVLKDNRRLDSVKFFGSAYLGGILDVVVRLDDFGNANANLTEVTFEAIAKKKQKNMPQLVSLTEAIRTVVSHQTATGTYPPNTNNIPNSKNACKGARNWDWVQFKWDGKFPKKRNWLLRNYKFKTPWVMFLDADEVITPAVVEELAAVLPRMEYNAFICYYDNWFMGRMLRHGDAMRKTAILRVGKGEYERIEEDHWSSLDMEIHEHLQVEGQIGEIKARLEHHDKRSLESYYAKHEEYAKWEAGRYAKLMSGSTLEASSLTHRQHLKYRLITKWWFGLAYFFACYILKRGFLDGRPGFIFARGKMRYFRNIRRKILSK